MSRRGSSYGNAAAESFFPRHKAELAEGGASADVSQARSESLSHVEGYYNRVRRHPALAYRTPEEFEREWKLKNEGRK